MSLICSLGEILLISELYILVKVIMLGCRKRYIQPIQLWPVSLFNLFIFFEGGLHVLNVKVVNVQDCTE